VPWPACTPQPSSSAAARQANASPSATGWPSIKGTVTGLDGKPLANVFVIALSSPSGEWTGVVTTASDGTYSIAVPAGSYILEFNDQSGWYYDGYYTSGGFTLDRGSATPVTVTISDVTGIDVQMEAGNTINGTVTGPGGKPLANITVELWSESPYLGPLGDFTTASDGTYSVPDFGSVFLYFFDPAGRYLTGWYSSSGFTLDRTSATLVTGTNSDVTGINVQMPTSKENIKGKVTGPGGKPIANISIEVHSDDYSYRGFGLTASDGTYSVAVVPGSYTVSFIDPSGTYDGGLYSSGAGSHLTSDPDSATPVAVTTSDVTGINVVIARVGATYYPVTPVRVLDSRVGPGHVGANLFHSRVKQTVTMVTDAFGESGFVVAVTGNVTVVGQTAAGYVSLAPSLTSGVAPGTSTINFPTGDVRANGVTVQLASGGTLDFMHWSSSAVDTVNIIFDVTGYFTAGPGGATYHTVTPYRVLDSRTGPGHTGGDLWQSQVKQTVTVATAASSIPTTAVAVTGTVTVVGGTAAGYVSLGPSLTSGVEPGTSTINFPTHDTRANGVTVQLASGGKLDFMYWSSSSLDTTDVLFDVTGYFTDDDSGASYYTVTPVRVLDSRTGRGHVGANLFRSRVKQTLKVATAASGVPTTAVAVTGNVTVVGQTAAGYVSLAPSLKSGVAPGTSTINFPIGDTRASGVTVPLASGGSLDFMYWTGNAANTTNILFDVTGYFVR
jgi:hypothetical protein